jgi:hypothetical protein
MIERVRQSAPLRWGLICGGIAGVATIVQGVLPFVALSEGADRVASYSIFLLYLALYFVAGLLTVRSGQTVTQGALAGLVAAVVSQALGGLVLVGIVIAKPLDYATSIGQPKLANESWALVLTAVMGLAIALMVYGTFGAALGALGGLTFPAKRSSGTRAADQRGA